MYVKNKSQVPNSLVLTTQQTPIARGTMMANSLPEVEAKWCKIPTISTLQQSGPDCVGCVNDMTWEAAESLWPDDPIQYFSGRALQKAPLEPEKEKKK